MVDSVIVEVGAASLYAEASGIGPPVVLLHTGITDRRMWDPQIPAFEETYRVIRYDARGYGNTRAPIGPYVPHEDLFAVMDAFDVSRANLVGASMGGATAIDAALVEPRRVASLVLIAPGMTGYTFTDAATVAYWALIEAAYQKGDYDRVVELEMELWVAGRRRGLAEVDPRIVELVRSMLRSSYPASAKFELLRPEPPAIERLAEIEAPTLIMVGDRDVPDMLRVAELIAARVPRALKVVMSGVAHLPGMERPLEVNALVLGHLDRVAETID